jgi:hypothetical protein
MVLANRDLPFNDFSPADRQVIAGADVPGVHCGREKISNTPVDLSRKR